MSMMDKMMEGMVNRMSIEEKQEMMLKMMPMMMKDVNMAETMLKMVPVMLDEISLLDLLKVLKKLFPVLLKGVNSVAELMVKWDELIPAIMKKMPKMMNKMMPFMEIVMPAVMSRMMPVMMKNEEHMKQMETMPEKMLGRMLQKEEMKDIMPKMMARMMPLCLKEVYPHMDDETKKEFSESMMNIINQKSA